MTHVKYAMLLRIRLPEKSTPIGKMFLIYFSLCACDVCKSPSTSVSNFVGGETPSEILTVISIVSKPFINGVNILKSLVPTA